MAEVSQIMRIASSFGADLQPAMKQLAAAVDEIPWMTHSPEAMSRGSYTRASVQRAFDNASAGVDQLRGTEIMRRNDHYGQLDEGVANLARILDDTPTSAEFVRPTDLVHSSVGRFESFIRRANSPWGSY